MHEFNTNIKLLFVYSWQKKVLLQPVAKLNAYLLFRFPFGAELVVDDFRFLGALTASRGALVRWRELSLSFLGARDAEGTVPARYRSILRLARLVSFTFTFT